MLDFQKYFEYVLIEWSLIFNKNSEGVENAKIMKIGSCDAVMNVTV